MTYLTLRASKKFSMRLHYPLWVFEIKLRSFVVRPSKRNDRTTLRSTAMAANVSTW